MLPNADALPLRLLAINLVLVCGMVSTSLALNTLLHKYQVLVHGHFFHLWFLYQAHGVRKTGGFKLPCDEPCVCDRGPSCSESH